MEKGTSKEKHPQPGFNLHYRKTDMAFPAESLTNLIKAQYPIIYLVSWEEERIENNLKRLKDEIYVPDASFYSWSTNQGHA